MSGEEGAAGARNVSGKVNETFKDARNRSTLELFFHDGSLLLIWDNGSTI